MTKKRKKKSHRGKQGERRRDSSCLNRYGERKPMQTKMKDKGSHCHIPETRSAPSRVNSGESTSSATSWKHKSPSRHGLKRSTEKGQSRCEGRAPRQLRRSPACRWALRELKEKSCPAAVDNPPQHVFRGEAECLQAQKAVSVHARTTSLVNIKAVNLRGGFSNRGVLAAGFSLLDH